MNEKQKRLAEYLRNLTDPIPLKPVSNSTEEVFIPESQLESVESPAEKTKPLTAESIVGMLEKIRESEAKGTEESAHTPKGHEFESLSPVPRSASLSAKPVLTDELIQTAFDATKKALNDEEIDEHESDVLEAIIIPFKRPVLDIANDDFSEPPPDWEFLNQFRSQINALLPLIGRIDVPDLLTVPYAGTGFFVGKGLLMTNRHVARFFTKGVGSGSKYVTLQSDFATVFDPKYEVGSNGTGQGNKRYQVKNVLVVHPHWDMALLEVEAVDGELPEGLNLAASPPETFAGGAIQNIIVVGYPMLDIRGDIPQQINIFRNIFGRKRLMPGFLNGYDNVETKWKRTLAAATHDASTLGGNSGSAIIDLMTGTVLALHFGGRYLKANYGVPMWELAKDSHVTSIAQLNFTGTSNISVASPPVWLDAWATLQVLLPEEAPASSASTNTDATSDAKDELSIADADNTNLPKVVETPLLPVSPDWFEHVTDTQLVEAMWRNPAQTESLIRKTLLVNEAEDLIFDLKKSISTIDDVPEEGILDFLLGTGKTDPTLPEIIYLHGIMGGHLASHEGIGGRVWLSPLAFIAGRVAQRLALMDDGAQDQTPNQTLFPDGHIRFVYEKSARKWRMDGFIVHEFSFDWRKSLINSADRLHFFIETLRLERPHKKFALVCHSMGGLVAAIYAARHQEWSAAVSQAIFIGSPLRGSFVPIEAFLGTYALYSKFDLVDLRAALKDYVTMSTTFPGLIDMLPDPDIFPDAAALYERPTWHKEIAPSQVWLDQSRRIKRLIATSPIINGANLIVSPDHPTINDVRIVNGQLQPGKSDKRGDGTVPLRSAAGFGIPNVKVYRASYGHSELPREPAVIAAVAGILKNGKCDLPVIEQSVIADLNVIAAPVSENISEAIAVKNLQESVAANGLVLRMRNGIFTQRDADFILRQNYEGL